MRTLRPALLVVSAAAILALGACKSGTYGGGESPEKPPANPDKAPAATPAKPAAK